MVARFTPDLVAPLWHRALDEEIGLAVACEDTRILRNALYEARQVLDDPRLDELMIFGDFVDLKEVWIVKKATEL